MDSVYYFMWNVEVLFDAFDSSDVRLELGAHLDEEVERLRDGYGERDGETH